MELDSKLIMRCFAIPAFSALLVAGCATPGPSTHESDESDDEAVDSDHEALTAEQCSYFDVNGKNQICHYTGSANHPYTILKTSEQACINGHAGHSQDYIAVGDPTCQGGGCLPVSAPCDATLPCCDGLTCQNGTCVDPCAGDPCENGGTCAASGASYICTCPAGFTGANCEVNVNDCAPNPCQNGGDCTDGVDSYTCTCTDDWTGANCDVAAHCTPVAPHQGNACAPRSTSFTAHADAPVGHLPGRVATADLNDDCLPDVIVNSGTPAQANVFLNQGGGTFAAPVVYATGTAPQTPVIADFDGDGKPDFAVTSLANTLEVRFNQGDGTLGAAVTYAAGSSPIGLDKGDFDNDGDTDLAVVSRNTNTVILFQNQGDGSFAAGASLAVAANSFAVIARDLDDDGDTDLAVGGFSSAIVFLNQGSGSFAAGVGYPTGTFSAALDSADFNADGQLDIVTVNLISNNASVLFNQGSGSFAAAVNYATASSPGGLAVADFNDDGATDFAVSAGPSSSATVFENQGDGTFVAAAPFATGDYPSNMVTGDFNSDGYPDLFTSNNHGDTVSVLLNDGTAQPGPCLNGGTCQSDAGDYTCSCPAGYSGSNCETAAVTCPCDGTQSWQDALAGTLVTTGPCNTYSFPGPCGSEPDHSWAFSLNGSTLTRLMGGDQFGTKFCGVQVHEPASCGGQSIEFIDGLTDAEAAACRAEVVSFGNSQGGSCN